MRRGIGETGHKEVRQFATAATFVSDTIDSMKTAVSPSAPPPEKRYKLLDEVQTEEDIRSLMAKDRMTITVYTSAFPPSLNCGGGCALRYFTIVKNLLKDGCKVVVFTPVCKQDILDYYEPFHHYHQNGSFVIEQLPATTNKMYPEVELTKVDFNLMKRVFFTMKANPTDLFLCPDNAESSVVLTLAKLAGAKRTVYGIHTDLLKLMGKRPDAVAFDVRAILLQGALFAHHIACSLSSDHCAISSDAFRKEISTRFLWKWVRVDNVFESLLWSPHFRLPLPEQKEEILRWRHELTRGRMDAPLLVYAGRWSLEKRIELLPACVPDGWSLAIVGDGPEWDAENTLALANDTVNVRRQFLSPQDLALVYASSDFLVSASDFETFGFVVLESLACGTPVAVQNAGGFKETVSDSVNGLLMNFENTVETIRRLEQYAPGTKAYALLKQSVLELASAKNNETRCFTQRLFERHAPKVWEEKYVTRAAPPKQSIAQQTLSLIGRFFLWVFVFIAFSVMSLAQYLFC